MRRLWSWIGCAVVWIAPLTGSAEGFFDLYGGITATDNQRIKIESIFPTIRPAHHYDLAANYGGRIGYWAEDPGWVGLALDVSFLAPEHANSGANEMKLRIVPVTPMVMFRYPLLADDEHPHGVIQPYIGGGPSFVWSKGRYRAGDPRPQTAPNPSFRLEDNQRDIGFDGRAGVSFVLADNIGLFVEYRFLFFRAIYDDSTNMPGFGNVSFDAKVQHISNSALAGISFRF